MTVTKEDFEEPRCVLCMEEKKQEKIPVARILKKADDYYAAKDYAEARRMLSYWATEAEGAGDLSGRLTVLCELLGIYRKTQQKAPALALARTVCELSENNDIYPGLRGTALINAATVYTAFGETQMAVEIFQKARVVYEKMTADGYNVDYSAYAGLCNNMASALADAGELDKACENYNAALALLEKAGGSPEEEAITYLNLANLEEKRLGLVDGCDIIDGYLDRAERIFEKLLAESDSSENPGYLSFVCEKCAPVFSYYGRFGLAESMRNFCGI